MKKIASVCACAFNSALIVALLVAALGTGCGGRSMGANNNLNSNTNTNDNLNSNTNTNDNQNNNNSPVLLTRRILVVQLVNGVMGYALDLGACHSQYPDVEADSPLCHAILIAEDNLGFRMGMPTGDFRPDDPVNKAEMWKTTVQLTGFLPLPGGCELVSDIPAGSWFEPAAGTLCVKGLMLLQDDGLAHPSENATLYHWYNFIAGVEEYLSQPATRSDVIEAVGALILDVIPSLPCTASFPDVLDNSIDCMASNAMLEEALLDPYQANLRPMDSTSWAELIKILVDSVGVPTNGCTGCSGTPCDDWSADWADAACEAGLLPEDYDAHSFVPTRMDLFRSVYPFMATLL